MPLQTAITLNTVSYGPRGTQNGLSTWSAAVSGSNTARATLTESVRGPLDDSRYRVRFVLSVPSVREEDSACGCAGSISGVGKADITVDIPGAYTDAERQALRLQIADLVSNAVFAAAIDDVEGSWG